MFNKKILGRIISVPLIWFYRLRYLGRVRFGKGVIVGWKFKFRGKGRVFIGDRVNLWCHEEKNQFFTYGKGAHIKIGNDSRLNGVTIQCRKSVEIGERCLIGSAIIIDNDFHSIYAEHRNDPEYVKSASIKIGNDVWVAGQSVILKGVSVGDEAVIGMRAVVTKDVPGKVVVAGNPARIVKEI